MGICCPVCGSENVRLSHLRQGDGYHLLRLRYPIRCRSCRLRGWTNFYWMVKLWRRQRAQDKQAALKRRQKQAAGTAPQAKP